MTIRTAYLLILTLSFFLGNAQSVWYFGQNAGINFLNVPVPLTNSVMNTPEGCAVNADNNAINFYTNGQTVWNRQHQIMTNGHNLNGSPLATQSAVIARVLKPNHYYLFTVDALAGPKGLCYSKVDMSLGNYGAVVEKNELMQGNMTEKLTVIQHCNKRDAWIVGHEWGTNRFFAWLITEDGVDPFPVISSAGSTHSGNINNTRGYMKGNATHDKIALCVQDAGFVEVFEFDNTFGVVSNPITITNVPNAYGVEFSPNGNLLYVTTTTGSLEQFSMVNYNAAQVNSSRFLAANSIYLLGAVQTGPDNRLYVAQDLSYYLGVINNPDASGAACDFNSQGVYLGGRKSEAGLPPKINDIRLPFMNTNSPCIGDTNFFSAWAPYEIDSMLWVFGDTLNAPNDTSTLFAPGYVYPSAGVFEVTLILYRCNSSDTLIKEVEVKDIPHINLGQDTSICDNQPYILSPGAGTNYLWSTGSTSHYIVVTSPGVYWVEVSNACGSASDTVEIKDIYPSPVFSLGNDTSLCVGDTLILCQDTSLGSLLWSTGLTDPCIFVTLEGMYQLTVTNEFNCSASDHKMVFFDSIPVPDLGNDTSICLGKTLLLNAGAAGTYLWNTGAMVEDYTVYETGYYEVTVSNHCGFSSSGINVLVEDCEKIIWIPNAFAPGRGDDNSVFLVKGLNVSDFELTIFNRFGEVLFVSNDINTGWDGTFKGNICQIGVYAWTLRYSDHNGQRYYHQGTLTLLR